VVAVDTNVLIRLITQDDHRQSDRAARLFQREEVWIAKTVLLETEWVLRSLYGFKAEDVRVALTRLAGLSNVHLEDPLAVAQALAWLGANLDFADGQHLASRGESLRFTSFDERLVKKAAKLGVGSFLL